MRSRAIENNLSAGSLSTCPLGQAKTPSLESYLVLPHTKVLNYLRFNLSLVCHLVARVGNGGKKPTHSQMDEALLLGLKALDGKVRPFQRKDLRVHVPGRQLLTREKMMW